MSLAFIRPPMTAARMSSPAVPAATQNRLYIATSMTGDRPSRTVLDTVSIMLRKTRRLRPIAAQRTDRALRASARLNPVADVRCSVPATMALVASDTPTRPGTNWPTVLTMRLDRKSVV